MTDYHSPGEEQEIPDPTKEPEPRTPPLDDPSDEGPGGVPDSAFENDDVDLELPDDPERDDPAQSPLRSPGTGRGTLNQDQPGRKDRETKRGGG